MRMRRRPDEAALQAEAADETLAFLVEHKLQAQSGVVGGPATEAIVGELLLLDLVTVNSLVACHVLKMNERWWKTQVQVCAVRLSPFASLLNIVIPSGVRA